MPRNWTAADLDGNTRPVWLLDVTYAGQVWRLASETVTVYDGSEPILYHGAIRDWPGVADEIDVIDFGGIQSGVTVSVSLDWPADIASFVASGYPLTTARADMSLWIPGTDYDDRYRVMLDGSAETMAPEYGAAGEPVGLTFVQSITQDRAQFPDPQWAVTTQRNTTPVFPGGLNLGDRQGERYPWVFGSFPAGFYAPTAELRLDGAQIEPIAVVVLADIPADPLATVDVRNVDKAQSLLGLSVSTTTDNDGTRYSYVSVSTATGWEPGDEILVDWPAEYLPRGFGGEAITSMGALAAYLLRRSSLTVDWGRTQLAISSLRDIPVAGYFTEPSTPWELIQDHILDIMPIAVGVGGDGLFLYHATAHGRSDAVAYIEAGNGWERTSNVSEEGPIINRSTLQYKERIGSYTESATIAPQDDAVPDWRETTVRSQRANSSAMLYGVREESITSDIIYRRDAAAAVLADRIEFASRPKRVIEYNADPKWGWLSPGDVVLLTDAELYIDGAVAIVAGRSWQPHCVSFVLVLRDEIGERKPLQAYQAQNQPVLPGSFPVVVPPSPAVTLTGGDLTWPDPIPPGYSA